MIKHNFAGSNFILDSEKVAFWIEERALLIADLHIGKSNHFQKAGMPVPSNSEYKSRLSGLLKKYKPDVIFYLGDLFHSTKNKEVESFICFSKSLNTKQILILGNHDILKIGFYKEIGLQVFDKLLIRKILLVHDPTEAFEEVVIGGHIHPKIKLRGKARQYLKLPCFHFSSKKFLMPSFGEMTGGSVLKVNKGESCYAIAEHEVISLS